MQCALRPEEGIRSLEAGVLSGGELPDMGAGEGTRFH